MAYKPSLSDTNVITVVVTNPQTFINNSHIMKVLMRSRRPTCRLAGPAQSGAQSIWFRKLPHATLYLTPPFHRAPDTNGVNEIVSPAIVLPQGNFQLHFRNNYNLKPSKHRTDWRLVVACWKSRSALALR